MSVSVSQLRSYEPLKDKSDSQIALFIKHAEERMKSQLFSSSHALYNQALLFLSLAIATQSTVKSSKSAASSQKKSSSTSSNSSASSNSLTYRSNNPYLLQYQHLFLQTQGINFLLPK